MLGEMFNLALKNGLWAVLFLFLLFYVLKDATNREKKYQNTIEKLNEHLKTVNEIKTEVGQIIEVITKPQKAKKKQSVEEQSDAGK